MQKLVGINLGICKRHRFQKRIALTKGATKCSLCPKFSKGASFRSKGIDAHQSMEYSAHSQCSPMQDGNTPPSVLETDCLDPRCRKTALKPRRVSILWPRPPSLLSPPTPAHTGSPGPARSRAPLAPLPPTLTCAFSPDSHHHHLADNLGSSGDMPCS